MKMRLLFTAAALAATLIGGQFVAAQQMSPYPMAGGYQPMAPMGYPGQLMQGPPPQFDVRQAAMVRQPMQAVGEGCVDGTCGASACNQCCVSPCWCHCVAVWGEYLYLRPRNAEVAYASPINGAIAGSPPVNTVQIAPLGMTDPDYSSGIRIGAAWIMDGCCSISAQYSWLESNTSDMVETNAPNVLRSLVSHPGTFNAGQDFLVANAASRIRFDWLDVDYRRVLDYSCNRQVTFLAGVRAGSYNQDFTAEFSDIGTETVDSEIDFYGAGLRVGLEGEMYSRSRRWMVYSKGTMNAVAGVFTADYRQNQSFDSTGTVDTTWKAGRIVPQLDMELGAGWQSRCGTWRLTGGYLFSAWYNTVKTDAWIDTVQANNFTGLSDTMTFDGLVLRCEGRF